MECRQLPKSQADGEMKGLEKLNLLLNSQFVGEKKAYQEGDREQAMLFFS